MDIASSVSQLHELCSEVVRWAGNYPEVTLGSWVITGVFIIRSIFDLICLSLREEEAVKTVEVIKPLHTPYIPGDTIVKLVKLLNSQNTGWTATYEKTILLAPLAYEETQLDYGKISFQYDTSGKVNVQHGGVDIDLKKFSRSPEMDQILLGIAYRDRLSIERIKQDNAKANKSAEAEKLANKELAHILDTI